MLDSTLVSVVIGLVLFYALLSVIISSINEFIVSIIGARGKNLAMGIRTMLSGGQGDALAQAVLNSPVVKNFGAPAGGSGGKSRLPSYLPAASFVSALIRALVPPDGQSKPPVMADIEAAVNKIDDPELRHRLTALLDEADGEIDKFRAAAELWYNNMMDRVSGWYKRKVSWILLCISIVVASVLNADTIVMIDALLNDASLRASVVQQAELVATEHPAIAESMIGLDSNQHATIPLDSSLQRVQEGLTFTTAELDKLDLLGWQPSPYLKNKVPPNGSILGWLEKVLGLLLTAMAISLGAPFWFDVLSKVSRLRSAGAAPPANTTMSGQNPAAQVPVNPTFVPEMQVKMPAAIPMTPTPPSSETAPADGSGGAQTPPPL